MGLGEEDYRGIVPLWVTNYQHDLPLHFDLPLPLHIDLDQDRAASFLHCKVTFSQSIL